MYMCVLAEYIYAYVCADRVLNMRARVGHITSALLRADPHRQPGLHTRSRGCCVSLCSRACRGASLLFAAGDVSLNHKVTPICCAAVRDPRGRCAG